jgi:hypothetical protein
MASYHFSATVTYVVWHEHLWDVSVLQRVHHPNLIYRFTMALREFGVVLHVMKWKFRCGGQEAFRLEHSAHGTFRSATPPHLNYADYSLGRASGALYPFLTMVPALEKHRSLAEYHQAKLRLGKAFYPSEFRVRTVNAATGAVVLQ